MRNEPGPSRSAALRRPREERARTSRSGAADALRQAQASIKLRSNLLIDVGPERYPECLAVLRSGFATEVADFGITRENTPSNPAFWEDSAVAAVVGKGFDLFAVEQDGRIVGCAFVGPSQSRPDVWSLRHLAVDPATRHAGYGAALVAEGARRARAAGAEALSIGIVAENVRLSEWYRRLGFESIDKTAYPGLVFTVERMRLELASI